MITFDVAVLGLGATGSAAAWRLARRGLRVVGLERFEPTHDRGSSHGLTRVIRQAYFEDPAYVPLVLRAYGLWEELERATGRRLLVRTGGVMIGPPDSPIVRGSLDSARTHGLRHRLLSSAELRSEYPSMLFESADVGLQEFHAGVLMAEDGVLAMQDEARRLGAELRFGVEARLDDLPAPKAVIAAGPWAKALLPSLPLQVERQVLHWFDPVPGAARCPLFIRDFDGKPIYSIPDVADHGVKVAIHHHGELTDPERVRREVSPEEVEDVRRRLSRTAPSLNGRLRASKVCLYTNSPDGHFVLGPLPGRPGVLVASPCSGHGFKFAPLVGELLAELAVEARPPHPLFDPARLLTK
jgi:sarcosine oxidase